MEASAKLCTKCRNIGVVLDGDGNHYRCEYCGMTVRMPDGTSMTAEGHNPDAVSQVTAAWSREAHDRYVVHRARSPWTSGSFYLAAFIAVVATLAATANLVPIVVLPAIVVAGLVATSAIGAFQLRHDQRISEKAFLKLMWLIFRQLPLIRIASKTPTKEAAGHHRSPV